MFILPQYHQNGMRIAVALPGIVMLPGGIINALVSMVSGRLFDKIGARIPATIGFALSIIGAALLLLITPSSPLGFVIACRIILMVGVPLAMSPTQTYALSSLPRELSTDGSTILNTLQQVLGAVCTAVATSLLVSGEAHYTAGGVERIKPRPSLRALAGALPLPWYWQSWALWGLSLLASSRVSKLLPPSTPVVASREPGSERRVFPPDTPILGYSWSLIHWNYSITETFQNNWRLYRQ